jgi:hypothetical protein
MTLEVTLPSLDSVNETDLVSWVPDLGEHLLEKVELEIGGITIDTHYGQWMHIWKELTRDESKNANYMKMIGSTTTFTTAASPLATSGKKLYVPINFWFTEKPSMAFPLIACQYHPMKVKITFADLQKITRGVSARKIDGSLGANLYVTYIYLDNEERKSFATSAHEYLITQVQRPGSETYQSQTNIRRRLDGFNHPVKEIVWVHQLDSLVAVNSASKDFSNFSDGASPNADPVASAKLVLNGNDRFSVRDGTYFNLVQPYYHHSGSPAVGIYSYSFAFEPEKHQPTGTCNFSRIDTASLEIVLSTTSAATSTVYMTNYNVGRLVGGMFGVAFAA